ncbi:MAG: S-layer homology domain-containing protein [Bryobacterales bacterium]|nr:S-layer homology domain-containing protein [Bryobacterales bacterium]
MRADCGYTNSTDLHLNAGIIADMRILFSYCPGNAGTITVTGLPPGITATGYNENPSVIWVTFRGTPNLAGVYPLTITGANYTIGNITLTIDKVFIPSSFTNVTVGQQIAESIWLTGVPEPVIYSLTGALPSGLQMSTAGLITGTVNQPQTATFTVTGQGSNGDSLSRTYNWTVGRGPQITTESLPEGYANMAYSHYLTVSGGRSPFRWYLETGEIPNGILLNSSAGTLSGAPLVTGTYPITLRVEDQNGVVDRKAFQLKVNPQMTRLRVTTNPPGLRVTLGELSGQGPLELLALTASTVSIATETLQQGTGCRYRFSHWSHGGPAQRTITVPTVYSVDNPITYTAYFDAEYPLTLNTSPPGAATFTLSPPSPDGYYAQSASVLVTPAMTDGYGFSSWSGGSAASNPQTRLALMNAPVTVTLAASIRLRFDTQPPSMPYVVDGVTRSGPFEVFRLPGQSVPVAAGPPQPQPLPGVRLGFLRWSDGGAASHPIPAPQTPTTYTATYADEYRIDTAVVPPQGSVSVSPQSADGYYPAGTPVTFTAFPSARYRFRGWQSGHATNPLTLPITAPQRLVAEVEPETACEFRLNQQSHSVSGFGDIGTLLVRTAQGCPWTAESDASWLTLTSTPAGDGSDSGIVTFRAAANPSALSRTAHLTVKDHVVTIFQSSSNCTPAAAPGALQLPAAASRASLSVTVAPGCQWTPISQSQWLELTANAMQRSGSAELWLTMPANPGPGPRVSSISLGGQVVPVIQSGASPVLLFRDVDAAHGFADAISYTAPWFGFQGCSDARFCPDTPPTRAETARVLIRALLGEAFSAPNAPAFTDVPATHPDFRYIQKLKELGITSGCSSTRFCPDTHLNREEMAVLLVRAKLRLPAGEAFPLPPAPYFTDVPVTHAFFPFIQKIRELGITQGCSATTYCPSVPVTRAQLAAFVTRAQF